MNPVPLAAMRHRLVLEDAAATSDGAGGSIVSWSPVADVWAAIRPRSGAERVEAHGIMGRATHEIIIRYRPGVTPRQRFRQGARIFAITAVIDAEEAHRFLTCLVEERVG